MPRIKTPYELAVERFIQQGTVDEAAEQMWRTKSGPASQKLTEYEKYKQAGGQGLSSQASAQLNNKNFYTAGTIKEYNPEHTFRSYLDQQAFLRKFRDEGVWDVEGNAPSAWSGTFLAAQIPALLKKYQDSQAADAECATGSAMAEYEKLAKNAERWKQLYAEKDRGYSGETMDDGKPNTTNMPVEEAARWQNWLMADYLLGDQEELFDFDAINSRYEAMSDEEYYAEEARLQKQFDELDWEALMNPQMPVYESKTAELEKQYNDAVKEQEARKLWDTYKGLAEQTPGTLDLEKYYAENIEGYDPQVFSSDRMANLVYFINHQGGSGQQFNVESMMQGAGLGSLFTDEEQRTVQSYYDKGYNYLLPDEIVVYNDLYHTDPKIAQGFLDSLEGELSKRRYMVKNAETEVLATSKELSVPMWMIGRVAGIADALMAPVKAAEALSGDDNYYGHTNDFGNMQQMVNAAQEAGLGEVEWANNLGTIGGKNILQHLYTGGTSAADNTLRIGAGGKFGALALAGLGSTSSALQELSLRDDMSGAAKVVQAGLIGGLEVVTEKIGLDNLFKVDVPSASKYLINSMGAEIGEEVVNAIGQEGVEYVVAMIFGHEAEIKSAGERGTDLLNTIVQTAISSLLMGGGGAISQDMNTRATGKQLQREGDIEGVLKIAESMPAGSASAQAAAPIRDMQKRGKKVSTRSLGKLVNAVAKDIGDENAATVNRIYEEAIEDRLVELGEDAASAKTLAPTIRKVSRGEKIPMHERAAIAWTDNASQVVKELATETREGEENRAGQSWKAQTQGKLTEAAVGTLGKAAQFREAMTSKTSNVTAAGKAAERAKALTKGNKGKNKLQAKELAYDDGTKGQGEFRKVIKDGDTLKVGISVDGSDQLKEVSVDSLTGAGDEGLATILEYAAYESRHEMSAEEINIMAGTYAQQGGDAGAFIQQFEESYLAGYSGVEQKPSSKLMQIAYDHGRYEAVKDEKNRVARAKEARSNAAPTVGWLGDAASDADVKGSGDAKALDEATKGMTEGQQLVVEFAKNLSRNTGLNIVMFRSKAMDGGSISTQNGSYDAATNTIYLDVNAGVNNAAELARQKEEGTLGYAIMRTMGHEVTHAIEATSVDFYDQYKQAVKEELTAAGKDWAQLVRQKLDAAMRAGQKLTYAGAEAEVVADASEYMLQDSQFVQNMDAGLKNKVKRIIQDFIGKIRAAFKALTGGHEESLALRTMRNGVMQYSERLQKLWDAGFVEMATAKVREDHIAEEGVMVQYSPRNVEADAKTSIKDQLRAVQNQLNTMDVVASVHAPSFDGVKEKERKAWAINALKSSGYKTDVKDFGIVEHGEKEINNSLNYLNSSEEIAAFACIPRVLKRGIRTSGHENHKGRNYTTVTFAAPVEINGMRGNMAVVVKQTSKNHYKTHRVLMPDGSAFVYNDNEKTEPTPAGGIPSDGKAQATHISSVTNSVSQSSGSVNGNIQKSAREQTVPVNELPTTRQFSMRTSVEKREDGLMAVHNLSADKLTDTLELGGFPMPSIAIVKAKHGHTMYGGYSVIFRKDTIDPEKNAENRVYGNDAWTPTFPPVETEIDSEKLLDVRKKMSDSVKKLDGYMAQRVQQYFNQLAGQQETTSRIPDLRDNAWNNHGMLAAYLTEQGQTVNIMTHEVVVDRGYNVENAEMYDAILDVMGDDANVSMRGIDIIEKYGQALADANDKLAVIYRRYQAGDRRSGIAMLNRVTQAKAYNAAGRDTTVQTKTENNYDATRLGMQAQIDRTAYNTWVEDVLAQFMGKKGIYNGKERFTNSGNRRSFKYLHDAYTAENVIRAMQKEPESDISPTNAKGLQAAAARRYDSIEAIRADSSRLGKVSEEEYNAALAEIDNELHDFLNSIEAWDYDKQEQAGNLLVKAAKSTMDNSGIVRLFKSNGFMKITPAKARHAQEIIRQAQNMPTGYFEAKPARVVNFDEVAMLIAPQDMPAELAAKLDELGIKYTTYDGTDEDRLEKANAVENVQFSRRDEAPDGVSIREFLGGMKPTDRMTETEKLLLKRYQENLRTLEEKEKLVAEQEEIIRTAPIKSDELTMAKNRYQIYRTQANRAARALMDAERSEGFARVMATSQEVVNRYLLGSAGAVGDAADVLDEEIAGLTAQLKAVEADVTRTASGQRTAFARGLFDQKQLNEAAQKLKDTYGSRMSVKAIADRLALAYGEIYADIDGQGPKMFIAAARDLAEDILRGNKFRYKSEILPMLAEQIGTISLTETDVQEIRNAGLTVSEYKRMLSPYIKVVQGGSGLSSYASNAEYYGEGALASVLGEDIEGNLAMQLYNVISREKAQETEISYEGMSEGQLIAEAMADIAGANLPMSTDSKTVDYLRKELLKYAGESAQAAQKVEQAIINAEKATRRASSVWRAAVQEVNTAKQAVEYYRKLDEQRRLTELKEQKQEITAQLRSDYAKKLEEKVQKQRTEYREREQKAREYRHSREELDKLRRRIGRNVKRLNTMRMRETDQRHVPQEFHHLADAVMQTFTDSSLAKLAFSAEKTASLARRYRLLQTVESDMTYYWDDEIEGEIENLVALSEAYNAIRERGAGVPSYFSVEGVKLETEILTGVDNIVSNVLQMIDSANDAFLLNRNETFEAYATKTGEEIRKKQDYKQLKGWPGKVQKMLDENIRTGNMTPIYFMEHLNSPLLKEVFDEVRMGQSDYAKIVAQGKGFVQEAKEKYHYGAWVADGKLKMKTSQGHQIELTREEAAEIYAIAKRESTNKLYQTEHLLYGGFQYKDITKKGEGLYAAKKESHQLDAADIAKISRWLTDEQKAYADTLVGFLSTTMADYGNAASMEMYGYKKFNETYYIPFHTAAEQRFQRGDEGPQGENVGTGRLKNSGFTHRLQHGANATLVVGGLTDTVSEHIHKMATYAAMVQPIENMKRLLNHKVMEPDGTVNTIRALIGQKYGQASQDYMTQLLKDLNGAAMGDERATDLVNSMIGAFKRGAVMASASVVLQQPTAMARAMAYISPKYFTKNPFYRPGKGTWDEMMKYAGTAVIKDMGKFDVGMGLTARQYIADEHLSAMEAYSRLKADSKWEAGKEAYKRALDWLTAAPGKADQWTWGLIWKAVKAEQAELHPGMDVNSEEFLQLCGDRFDDVIDHTQVYDSVITRSNLMRSKNALHRMATSFMAEPTLSINMLYDAFLGKHDKKQRGKILGGVIVSQVLAGAMAALAQAWNDDEDKRNVVERYADRATANILDNLNPLGMLPYVSDLMSLFAGYEVERPDMAAVADIIDYGKTFITKAADPEKTLTWKDYENFVGTIANMAGLPAKNISREVRRTRNLIMNSQWTAPDAFSVGQAMLENVPFYQSKNAVYYERIVAAELNGDTQKAQDYREYMLLSKMVSEDAMKTGLKKAMQERFISGDADEDAAKQYLLKIGAYADEDDAYWEVDKWKEMRDEGIAAGDYRKYADFFQAVETGENLRTTIKEYLDNGVSKTTLASQITTQYKQQLIDLKATGKGYADLQARLLTAYEALGYDRAQKQKDIQRWFE